MSRVLPLGVLLAASSLSAQSYVALSGAGGVSGESYSAAIVTDADGSYSELNLRFFYDYLVVGGGGAGGTGGGSGGENTWGAGGGGAGGVITGQHEIDAWDVGDDFWGALGIYVGAGGAAAAYSAGGTSNGASGNVSWFSNPNEQFVALGGGGGAGSNNSATGGVGLDGASGGGGGGDGLRAGGAGTAGQGYSGGTSRSGATNRSAGGGGGGAGGVGQIGGPPNGHNSGVGGNGGIGLASSITGSSVYYGGGGGGGGRDTNGGATSAGGTGGTGGGGAGSGQGAATSGTDGFGGGGGGSGADGKGGDGGDGVVIIRYKGAAAGTGGTVTSGTGTAAGYTIHTFSTVGNSTLDLSATDLSTRLGADVTSTVTGTGALRIDTVGTIVYRGNAYHTGGTQVVAGTFQLGNGGVHGSIADSAVTIASGATFAVNRSDALLTLYNSVSGAGTFAKKGANQVTLQGDFSGLSGSIEIENGVLNLANANGTSYAVAAGTSGAGALTKSSDGTVILSGNLAHTGGTTVSRGKLVINGTHDGAVTVLKGAGAGILGGSGTITGDTTIFGFHTPGNSPGIQTFEGNLTYESGSFLQWELGAQTTVNSPLAFDQIVVGGDLTFAGPTNLYFNFSTWAESTVDWADAFWNGDRSWLLIDVAGTTTGIENLSVYSAALTGNWVDSNGVPFATARPAGSFSVSQVGSDVYLNYSATPVPEPSTYGLILGGLALAGAAIRRRKTKGAR